MIVFSDWVIPGRYRTKRYYCLVPLKSILIPVLYGELLCPPLTKQYYALSLSMKINQWGCEDVCCENFTGPVQFESHSPKWWVLSKFSFQQLCIGKLHSLFYLLKFSIFFKCKIINHIQSLLVTVWLSRKGPGKEAGGWGEITQQKANTRRRQFIMATYRSAFWIVNHMISHAIWNK